jgi:hypothetical protein
VAGTVWVKQWDGNTIKSKLFLSEVRIKDLKACIVTLFQTDRPTLQVSFEPNFISYYD